ncbi:2-isopropylmalate synthase [Malaciobacter molluscorum LMG 25693]|uniref:2-isopropylmalate synthase n=1 Tax=Malaciobacter molluscorum LMG 25693 TaxID=870501 RepID=A0A2G1DFD5_9BACT|nr:2-isopropylmalate synthase [Malaciobacter molluscorum]AXX91523.1 2-isopropylmalate synthase [Malaciobacter molluscorum LMG 25693]PHO17160.1 2-isopropylmalate synthase [Malaciobacter molluscorum LMG 25693]RXJ92780.1 2-isopropylmalate synthase [Malaciobacter molluscorum]
MDKNRIYVFDTTLRDGEQSPGCSMNTEEKIKVALQLEKLGVDVIEAGFAAASPGDFDAVSRIAQEVEKSSICSLSRAVENDIKQAGLAVEKAKLKRIHTFIATSPIHMKYKLKMSEEEVIKRAIRAVEYAKTFVDDVEFSLEDAGRSEIPFMKEVMDAVINAGATTINLPDTVGYRLPTELSAMIKELSDFAGNRAIISVHNHNDLGLATANTLAAVASGARQIEVTINGLGERAGNSALEEAVMAIKTRKDAFGDLYTNINTKELYATSRLVATITGVEPQQNKAIVGKNAFSHESGIHQDGVLKHQETYEIMKPEDVGVIKDSTLILGKHSGRAAFRDKINQLGFDKVSDEELNSAFEKFKVLADKKKDVTDDDVRMLITDESLNQDKIYELDSLQISDCSNGLPTAAVSIKFKDEFLVDANIGNGTMDAIFKTIDRLTGYNGQLQNYNVTSVTEGQDALAKVTTRVVFDETSPSFVGHGLSVDTMVATAKAYISALNSYLSQKERLAAKREHQV